MKQDLGKKFILVCVSLVVFVIMHQIFSTQHTVQCKTLYISDFSCDVLLFHSSGMSAKFVFFSLKNARSSRYVVLKAEDANIKVQCMSLGKKKKKKKKKKATK